MRFSKVVTATIMTREKRMNIDKRPIKDVKAELHDKVLGSLVGFAIGDAMGATTEFMNEREIKARYGRVDEIIGGGWLNLKPGEVTDDTQMMLCIIDVFLNNKHQAINLYRFGREVMAKFVEWYESNPPDVGGACMRGIEYFIYNNKFIKADNQILGNGGLMRALPCYLMGNLMFNYTQNDMTHNNSVCREFIKMYHEVMDKAMQGDSFPPSGFGMMEPTGKVHNTFYNARTWGMCSRTFEDAIVGAVNQGGDADTIAALAGSIAGARFGFGNMLYRWVDILDRNVVRTLYEFADMVVEHKMGL